MKNQPGGFLSRIPGGQAVGNGCGAGASIPMGHGGDTSPKYLDWGNYHECPPQYFYSNISFFLSMQYFLDTLKEFLVFLAD